MNTQEFFDKYNNKPINYDGAFGNQCMDVYRQYCKELGLTQSPGVNGAKDVWNTFRKEDFTQIVNTPTGVPQKGDVVIWGVGIGTFGHIAIFDRGDTNSFTSFDQNYPVQGYIDTKGNHIGTGVCHFQNHSYTGVLGWLRPKATVQPTPQVVTITDQTKIPQIDNLEVQAIRSRLNDQASTINTLNASVASLNQRIRDLEAQVIVIPPSDNSLKQTLVKVYDITWGKGWPWTKINQIKVLLPK